MASLDEDWKIPAALQPKPRDCTYDLDRALSSVVGLSTQVPADAFTAEILGTERSGNGVLIRDDGLVLTIGYLITEAEEVWLTTNAGRVVPGHALAYDQLTGFGLVQALGRLDIPVLPIGESSRAPVGEQVVVAAMGGRTRSVAARMPTSLRAERLLDLLNILLSDVTLAARRHRLLALRTEGVIGDRAFHRLEEELDLSELATATGT